MGLLTWIILTIVILSIIGQGWDVFVSSVFRGINKVLNRIGPIARDLGNEARQYADNITKDIPNGVGNI
jgi:uncharacterized membrane protein